ncbi:unnamed protein product, partial [Coregonus sp. 'balchen']
DTIHGTLPTLDEAFLKLQEAFVVQHNLFWIKLVLNAEKTKVMEFSRLRKQPPTLHQIFTLLNKPIEICNKHNISYTSLYLISVSRMATPNC